MAKPVGFMPTQLCQVFFRFGNGNLYNLGVLINIYIYMYSGGKTKGDLFNISRAVNGNPPCVGRFPLESNI